MTPYVVKDYLEPAEYDDYRCKSLCTVYEVLELESRVLCMLSLYFSDILFMVY